MNLAPPTLHVPPVPASLPASKPAVQTKMLGVTRCLRMIGRRSSVMSKPTCADQLHINHLRLSSQSPRVSSHPDTRGFAGLAGRGGNSRSGGGFRPGDGVDAHWPAQCRPDGTGRTARLESERASVWQMQVLGGEGESDINRQRTDRRRQGL